MVGIEAGESLKAVLDFWFQELSPQDWFKKSEALDQDINKRFNGVLKACAAGECWEWRKALINWWMLRSARCICRTCIASPCWCTMKSCAYLINRAQAFDEKHRWLAHLFLFSVKGYVKSNAIQRSWSIKVALSNLRVTYTLIPKLYRNYRAGSSPVTPLSRQLSLFPCLACKITR